MKPTGWFKRGAAYRASALTLVVLMAPAPSVPLIGAARAPARTQGAGAAGPNATQQTATDIAVTMFGPGAKDWPAYKNADGSVVVQAPAGQPVVRVNAEGSNDVWQRDYQGRWEHGKLVAGVHLVYGNSQQTGDDAPPKRPSDATTLPPLTTANKIFVGGETEPLKASQNARAAQAAVAAQIEKANDEKMAKVNALKGDWTINGVQLAPGTVAGLVTIRDIYSQQIGYFEKFIEKTQKLSDAEKTALINQILPAVNSAILWRDLRWHFRNDGLAGWHDYFDAQKAKARAAGDTKTADLIDQAMNTRNGLGASDDFMLKQMFQALDSNPLVAAFVAQMSGQATGPASSYVTTFNTALQGAYDKAKEERARVDGINTVNGMTEFFSPQYERIWQAASTSTGKYSQAWFRQFGDNAASFSSLQAIVDRKWDDVLAAGVIGLAVVSVIFPPIAIALGAKAFAGTLVVGAAGLSLFASGTQLVWDGQRAWVINTQANNAAAGQSALGAAAVHQLDDQANDAFKQVILDGGIVILDAAGLALAAGEYKGLVKAQALDEARQAAIASRGVEAQRLIAKLPEAQATIYQKAGLLPNKTVTAGGRTFHISLPFEGPGGRTGVIAFEEGADGKVFARTWYLSNEHGIWKAAPNAPGGLIGKGPQVKILTNGQQILPFTPQNKLLPGFKEEFIFMNEGTVDLTAEMQGALFNELNQNGVIKAEGKLQGDAFYEPLEFFVPGDHTPFHDVLAAESGMPAVNAVNRPFPNGPGALPNPTPTSSWTANLNLYGRTEGFTFVSQDGKLTYTVLRFTDPNGVVRVWVPSVQEAGAVVTPFGTKATAINTPFTSTPIKHASDFVADPIGSVAIPNTGGEYLYVFNTYGNKLNEHFAQILPPPGSVPTTGLSGVGPLPQTPITAGGAPVALNSPVALGGGAVLTGGRLQLNNTTISGNTANPFIETTPTETARASGPNIGTGTPVYTGLDSVGRVLLQKMDLPDGPSPTPDLDEAAKYHLDFGWGTKPIKLEPGWNYTPTPRPTLTPVLPTTHGTSMFLPQFGQERAIGSTSGLGYDATIFFTTPSLTATSPTTVTPSNPGLAIALKYINSNLAGGTTVTRTVPINGVGLNTFQPFGPFTGSPAPIVPVHNTDGGGWGSCSSCHPFGTPDNLSFASNSAWFNLSTNAFVGVPSTDAQNQRVLNWTAIFDELQDYQSNVMAAKDQSEATDGGTFLSIDGYFGRDTPASLTDRLLSMASGIVDWTIQWFEPRLHAQAAKGVSISFIATGNASGDAFKLRVVNPSGEPLAITIPDGLVLEPTSAPPTPAPAGAREFALAGYCAEVAKAPPTAGRVYRIAKAATQQRLGDAKYLLRAVRQLASRKALHPDSDEALYAQSIRQYALWAKLEKWTEKQFGDALLEKTKKNVLDNRQNWTKELEAAVKAATPNRWQDIQRVIAEAETLKPK